MKSIKFNGIKGEIARIYTGKGGCRCGCGGKYWEPGQPGFARALNKIRKINPFTVLYETHDEMLHRGLLAREKGEEPHKVNTAFGFVNQPNVNGNWVDLVLPNGRTITVYFQPGATLPGYGN